MRTANFVIAFIIFASCAATNTKNQNSLDKLFEENIDAFERVADGKSTRTQLSAPQVAFLYLLADWSSRPSQFDHYKDLSFTSNDVQFWRQWYSKKKQSLELDVVQKAITLQTNFFAEGLLSEADMDFLNQTSARMRAL